jgi:hypothetical protein
MVLRRKAVTIMRTVWRVENYRYSRMRMSKKTGQ